MDIQEFRNKRSRTKSRCEADVVSRKYSVKKEKVYRIAKNAQGSRKGVLGTANRPSDSKIFHIQGRANGYSRMLKKAETIVEEL